MKNIGIFGEYEEKHQRLLDNLAMYQTMKQFIESLGQYPEDEEHDAYTEQMMESLFEIINRYTEDARKDDDYKDHQVRATFKEEALKSQVVVGDLVEPEGIPLKRYYGVINVVVWVPENFAAFTNLIYINQNDWIRVYSPKVDKEWTLKMGEYKKINKNT